MTGIAARGYIRDHQTVHVFSPQIETVLGCLSVRNFTIFAPISAPCVSSAKCPVFKSTTSACGLSRLKASAPAGRKIGSVLPHTASVGGRWVRKYCWNRGYNLILLA